MKSEKRRPRLNLLVSSAITLFLSGGIWYVNSAQQQSREPEAKSNADQIKVVNNVDVLEVVRTTISGPKFVVSVRNKSQKNINSFYVASDKEAWQVELIYSDTIDSVLPSTDFDISIPVSTTLYTNGLAIRAVLYDDNSGAGEPEFTKLMLDRRRGEKQELIKGKRVLEELVLEGKSKPKEKLEYVKEKFTSLQSEAEQNESVKLGMHLGRQRFLQAVERIERTAEAKPASVDFELKKLITQLQKYVSKL
jgi:hypothetical protein